jgi:hypothetical protein
MGGRASNNRAGVGTKEFMSEGSDEVGQKQGEGGSKHF